MMKYDLGTNELSNWLVAETQFSSKTLGKVEAAMCLGNGYMGLRSATEEHYPGETRDLLVAGTFNKFDDNEVTELPNAADVTQFDIKIDGDQFSLDFGSVREYVRYLNLKHAELVRELKWISPHGKEIRFCFRRFVSFADKHIIAMKLTVEPLNGPVCVELESGINIRMTNGGAQHFSEGDRRIFDRRYIQQCQTTTQSKIDFVINTAHTLRLNAEQLEQNVTMEMARRKVWLCFNITVERGQCLEIEKITTIHTSRDNDGPANADFAAIRADGLDELKRAIAVGYDGLFARHRVAWNEQIWSKYHMTLDSDSEYDLLALRFALYHLTIMTPMHDERMGIAAKGMSGEGYKGHSFWDTEIFVFPFYIYSNPAVAKSLLMYRYHGLAGAHKKAAENGYQGAMYPWEMAWPTDGEVTPVWGAVDIVTGLQTKIWSGFIEQHITADIAYAVWSYYCVTGDQAFMDAHGYEMIFDTAKFWSSRLEWNAEKQRYHINDVIGADEYKEHVDNNAFTNYMAHFNIELAMQYFELVKTEKPELFARLDSKLALMETYTGWLDRIEKIYLPQPRPADAVIPQDDTYLSKKIIDLSKYKNQQKVGSMFYDYNLEQANEIQVSKQADIMMLFYLLESKFAPATKIANYNYYEPKTLHDSSLSLSTHAILANDLGHYDLAYELFERAARIDLGENMHSSDEGIHAASIGGIWQIVVMGFAGVRMNAGKLRICPKLPDKWSNLSFGIYWQQQQLNISIDKQSLVISTDTDRPVTLTVFDKEYSFSGELRVALV